MTAADVPAPARPGRPSSDDPSRLPARLPGRLLRLELRRNTMLWVLPLLAALFWLDTYRRTMTFTSPPLWSLRSYYVQSGGPVSDCSPFAAGVAAWLGSREGRRGTTDLVTVTARPRWAARLWTWAATAGWAVTAYLGCVAVIYGMTATRATWGGPLWWPVAVGAAAVAAICALGFAVGVFLPGRFTAPLTAIVVFFTLTTARTAVNPGSTFTQVLPVKPGFDMSQEAGVFFPYLPDVNIDQVMFLAGLTTALLGALGLPAASGGRWLRAGAAAVTAAGLLAAGTALGLAGTASQSATGTVIPALHDAANDQPIAYAPVCGSGAIPVCVHPAYRDYLATVADAVDPVLDQVAGLPGAPVRVVQVATSEIAGAGDPMATVAGTPPVMRLALDGNLPGTWGSDETQFTDVVRPAAATAVLNSVIGDAGPAQQAVEAALARAAGLALLPPGTGQAGPPVAGLAGPVPGSPTYAAAGRFAALPATARHAWLASHLAALRSGGVTLAELP